MSEIIKWLSTNQGFVLGILTLVYVVTTVIMARLMMLSNQITRELEKQRLRPFVIFDLESRHGCIYTILSNIGQTPAYEVKVNVTPSVKGDIGGKARESTLTTNKISFLAPHRELSDFVESNALFYKAYETPIFTGNVEYKAFEGREYKENFTIDLTFQKDHMYVSEKDVGRELEKIAKAIEKFSAPQFKPSARMIDEKYCREEQERFIEETIKRSEEKKSKEEQV